MDVALYRQKLQDLLAEADRLDAMTEDARKPVELDQTTQGRLSRMDALQVQAMSQATTERRRQDKARIKAALARMDAGDFGYCVICDEEISKARLDHDPAPPTCIDCARG